MSEISLGQYGMEQWPLWKKNLKAVRRQQLNEAPPAERRVNHPMWVNFMLMGATVLPKF